VLIAGVQVLRGVHRLFQVALATPVCDASRLKRLELEAQSAAPLNHPSIHAVYQLRSYQGAPYRLELLESETLREQLKLGALSQRRAMDSTEQM
jgi:hypothetical protein